MVRVKASGKNPHFFPIVHLRRFSNSTRITNYYIVSILVGIIGILLISFIHESDTRPIPQFSTLSGLFPDNPFDGFGGKEETTTTEKTTTVPSATKKPKAKGTKKPSGQDGRAAAVKKSSATRKPRKHSIKNDAYEDPKPKKNKSKKRKVIAGRKEAMEDDEDVPTEATGENKKSRKDKKKDKKKKKKEEESDTEKPAYYNPNGATKIRGNDEPKGRSASDFDSGKKSKKKDKKKKDKKRKKQKEKPEPQPEPEPEPNDNANEENAAVKKGVPEEIDYPSIEGERTDNPLEDYEDSKEEATTDNAPPNTQVEGPVRQEDENSKTDEQAEKEPNETENKEEDQSPTKSSGQLQQQIEGEINDGGVDNKTETPSEAKDDKSNNEVPATEAKPEKEKDPDVNRGKEMLDQMETGNMNKINLVKMQAKSPVSGGGSGVASGKGTGKKPVTSKPGQSQKKSKPETEESSSEDEDESDETDKKKFAAHIQKYQEKATG